MGQVYIEDYVVSFLKQKKTEVVDSPIKLAIYGNKQKAKTLDNLTDDDEITHYIYGAATLEENRTVEEIGNEFFPEHKFLGYVNIHNNNRETISSYHIFYEENISMQDYLLKSKETKEMEIENQF